MQHLMDVGNIGKEAIQNKTLAYKLLKMSFQFIVQIQCVLKNQIEIPYVLHFVVIP